MNDKYKEVSIYADKNNVLYAIPCGYNAKFNIPVSADILDILEPPYDNERLETFMLMSMGKCYLKEVPDIKAIGALEKHFNVKRWNTAVRGLKYVSFSWSGDEGYRITPTIMKSPKDGFNHIIEKIFDLGFNPSCGEIATALLKALDESIACK